MGDDAAFVTEKEVVDDIYFGFGAVVDLDNVFDDQPAGAGGGPPGVVVDDVVAYRDVVALFRDFEAVGGEATESAIFDEQVANLGVEAALLHLFGRVPPVVDYVIVIKRIGVALEMEAF